MNILCVDDEVLLLNLTVSLCKELPDVTEVTGFWQPQEALAWAKDHAPDVALLDIDMPGMSGLELAKGLKEAHPDTAVIFLTGYAQYAVDAFAMHASGYLLKPVDKARLAEEVAFAAGGKPVGEVPAGKPVQVRTFGAFEVLKDGRPVTFGRSKAKELFAYLVDRQGGSVTRAEAFSVMWEDGFYDRSMQKQLDVIIRSLRQSLEENGISAICEMNRGGLRAVPEAFDCDLYRFLAGDVAAVNAYRGEYMSAYSWASFTEGYLDGMRGRKR